MGRTVSPPSTEISTCMSRSSKVMSSSIKPLVVLPRTTQEGSLKIHPHHFQIQIKCTNPGISTIQQVTLGKKKTRRLHIRRRQKSEDPLLDVSLKCFTLLTTWTDHPTPHRTGSAHSTISMRRPMPWSGAPGPLPVLIALLRVSRVPPAPLQWAHVAHPADRRLYHSRHPQPVRGDQPRVHGRRGLAARAKPGRPG